jgi:hypothetical protein
MPPMPRTFIPPEVLTAAHRRSEARAAGDWPAADGLRAEIEAAGWRVVDAGTDFRLEPLHAPDVVEGGRLRYGRSDAVPSRLGEAPQGLATVVIAASGDVGDVLRSIAALRRTSSEGVSIVVVGDALDGDEADAIQAEPGVELILTSARLGQAAAWNVGLRRASAPIVALLDPSIEATGDLISPLVASLDDPTAAVAGPFGLVSDDLRRFTEVETGPAAAIEGYALAFRRSDGDARGPLDEHFQFYRNLDVWWSLVLRDEGPDSTPRRAVVVPGLPLVRHEHRAWIETPEPQRTRLSKRNFYRVLDRFGSRQDLAVPGP